MIVLYSPVKQTPVLACARPFVITLRANKTLASCNCAAQFLSARCIFEKCFSIIICLRQIALYEERKDGLLSRFTPSMLLFLFLFVLLLLLLLSFLLLLLQPAAEVREWEGRRGGGRVKKKKNPSRQNANEPGSYYDANEIPPSEKLLLRYSAYISSIFGWAANRWHATCLCFELSTRKSR